MNWQLICRVGDADDFAPAIGDSPRLSVKFDEALQSVQVNNDVSKLLRDKGLQINDAVFDLLQLAMVVYYADLRIDRIFAADRWTRQITIHLSVADVELWEGTSSTLINLLNFLTGDVWNIQFRNREPLAEAELENPNQTPPDVVALFSGGLDSFVGAIDLLEEFEGKIGLVGQHGKGPSINPSQTRTMSVLSDRYANRADRFGFYVQPTKPGKKRAYENTMRARSILFLALGTAVASACGEGVPLYVPENGLISLNVPLSHARTGSFSTRTTHPYFISLFRKLLNALSLPIPIQLPYKFTTKGEMIQQARNQDALNAGLDLTLSCARPDAGRYQGLAPGHCGYCVPCIIRLSSMKSAGFDTNGAAYFDIVNQQVDPASPRGTDRRGFEIAVERTRAMSSLRLAGEVLQSGPIPHSDIQQYADVYRRGLDEVADFLEIGNN